MRTHKASFIFMMIVAAIALANAGSTLYLPAMPIIAVALHSTAALMKLSLSLFLLGLGVSQLIYGPLSDAFGRRIILLIGLGIFLVGSVISASAHEMNILLIGRLVEGLGIGCANSAGYALLRDIYSGHELTLRLGYASVFVGVTPLAGPVIGGYLVAGLGWESCFYFLALVALILIFIKYVLLPETNLSAHPSACHPKKILKGYGTLLTSASFMGFALCAGVAIAAVFTMGSFLPFLLVNDLGIKVSVYAWIAGLPAIGYLTGSFVGGKYSQKTGLAGMILIAVIIQACMIGLGLFLNQNGFNVYSLMTPLFFFMFGIGLCVPTGSSGAMAPFPNLAGFESALLCAFMFGCAAIFTAIGSHLGTSSAESLFVLLGGITVLILIFLGLVKLSCC